MLDVTWMLRTATNWKYNERYQCYSPRRRPALHNLPVRLHLSSITVTAHNERAWHYFDMYMYISLLYIGDYEGKYYQAPLIIYTYLLLQAIYIWTIFDRQIITHKTVISTEQPPQSSRAGKRHRRPFDKKEKNCPTAGRLRKIAHQNSQQMNE